MKLYVNLLIFGVVASSSHFKRLKELNIFVCFFFLPSSSLPFFLPILLPPYPSSFLPFFLPTLLPPYPSSSLPFFLPTLLPPYPSVSSEPFFFIIFQTNFHPSSPFFSPPPTSSLLPPSFIFFPLLLQYMDSPPEESQVGLRNEAWDELSLLTTPTSFRNL